MKVAIGPLVRHLSQRAGWIATGPQVALATAGLTAVAAFMLLRPILPAEAMLPFIATLFFLMACIAVQLAWRDESNSRSLRLNYWDVSGLLTLIGICVTTAIEPEGLVRLLGADNRPQ